MEPTIKVGDIIITKNKQEKEIEIGDIITYKENGSIVTHRVVEIVTDNGKTGYKTKGDNNNAEDNGVISYKDIEGGYLFRIPYVGKIIIKAQTPQGIVCIVILLYVIYEILSSKEDRKQYRHEKRIKYEAVIKENTN